MKLPIIREWDFILSLIFNQILIKYKLIVIPGHVIIDSAVVRTTSNFVADGGTVIMTGYSGIADTNGQVFIIPRPGMLTDVFGIRISGFYRTDLKYHRNVQSEFFEVDGKKREVLYAEAGHHSCRIQADYYEQIELREAVSYSNFRDKQSGAVSVNNYGQGRTYNAAVESNSKFIVWLMRQLEDVLGMQKSLPVPMEIQAQKIEDG